MGESNTEELTPDETFNQALEKIRSETPEGAFTNYFRELLKQNPSEFLGRSQPTAQSRARRLVEGYVQSVLDRINVPHVHDEKIISEDFFQHISDYTKQLAKEENKHLEPSEQIDVNIFIGGGVVRSMLANMYKFVYERKQQQESTTKSFQAGQMETSLKNADLEQIQRKNRMLKSTEFHLVQSTLAEKDKLLSPFVLGAGSDLDVYYEIKPAPSTENNLKEEKPKTQLTNTQINAGERIKEKLTKHINQIESQHGLKKETNPLKHSILPIADVKEYHQQITRALGQGGSLLDTLAFKLVPSNEKRSFQLRHPEAHSDILDDFLQGVYQYLPPQLDEYKYQVSQKQAIRGLRALMEIPFLDIQDPTTILAELEQIIEGIISQEMPLEEDAKKQFDKMIRNANFQGAFDRAHAEGKTKKKTPLSLGLAIAEAAWDNVDGRASERVRFLLPAFLQKMPITEPEPKKIKGQHYDTMKEALKPYETFIKEDTVNGTLFHGTSATAGMCVLRAGFILSTEKQGIAVFGPGVYATKSHEEAMRYCLLAEQGMMLPLRISAQKGMKIVDWTKLPEEQKQMLETEAYEKGYKHVYDLLRDRKQYGIDIILNEHVILQNQSVIDLENSLEAMLDWLQSPVCLASKELEKHLKEEDLFKTLAHLHTAISSYTGFHQIIKNLGGIVHDKPTPFSLFLSAWKVSKLNDIGKLYLSVIALEQGFLEDVKNSKAKQIKRDVENKMTNMDLNIVGNALFLAVINACSSKGMKKLIALKPEVLGLTYNMEVTKAQLGKGLNLLTLAMFFKRLEIVADIIATYPEATNYVIMDGDNEGDNALTFAISHWYFSKSEEAKEIAIAIIQANPKTASYVVTEGSHKGHTPLTLALSADQIQAEVVMAIIQANPETVNHVITEGKNKGHNALILALSAHQVQTEVVIAIIQANPETVNHLFTDNNHKDQNPLTLAITKNLSEIALAIIQANQKTTNHVITEGSDKGHTPLTLAIQKNFSELALAIIQANPKTTNHMITEGDSPLDLAYIYNSPQEVIDAIIKTNPVAQDGPSKGLNPLARAIHFALIENPALEVININPKTANQVITEGDFKGETPLTLAIEKNFPEVVDAIIQANPDTANHVITEGKNKGHNALSLAISDYRCSPKIAAAIVKANSETANHVVTKGNNLGDTPLTLAILKQPELAITIIESNPETTNHVITEGCYKGNTPFTLAVSRKEPEVIDTIIKATPKTLNYVIAEGKNKGHNALTLVMHDYKSKPEVVVAIIQANPDTVNHVITKGFDKNHTPLTLAIQKKQPEVALAIIKANPETINHVVEGLTPLAFSIYYKQPEVATAIMNANPKTANHVIIDDVYKGYNLLALAIEKGQQEIAAAIIQANPETINYVISDGPCKGMSPRERAKQNGMFPLLSFIDEQQAKLKKSKAKKSLRFSEKENKEPEVCSNIKEKLPAQDKPRTTKKK